MKSVPDMTCEYEREELAELNAPKWMLDLLQMNPGYVGWGVGDDYMKGPGSGRYPGWDSGQRFSSWSEFGPWGLDDLNECVNFYFEVQRDDGAKGCRLSLTLWYLHPRKGCSRGVEVLNIAQSELPAVFAFLRNAASRNAERFSRVPGGV